MLGLDKTGYQSLRGAVAEMVEKHEITPFCEAVSKFLLHGLDGRDVISGEDPFAQAVYDSLSLARFPGDIVKKEYKVSSKIRASGGSGAALDVVYLRPGTPQEGQPRQLFCFSLKSVPIRRLDKWKHERTWEKQVEISRSAIDCANPADILNLCLDSDDPFYRKEYGSSATVSTVLNNAVTEAQDKYIPPLETEVGPGKVHCWVLVRVGMKHIICRKV